MGLLPIFACLVYFLLSIRLPFPTFVLPPDEAGVLSVVVGLCLWFGLWTLLDIKQYKADLLMMNQGFLKDGERIVVSGALHTEAPLLKTPFSEQECLGYYYKVSRLDSSPGSTSHNTRWTYYEGCAIVPTSIKSPLGNMKIQPEKDIELFYEVPKVSLNEKTEQARKYLQSCPFSENFNGPCDFRVDKKLAAPEDLEKCDLDEKVIRQGENAVIIGIYSSEDGGIIKPEPGDVIHPFHIVPDGEKVLKKKLKNRFIAIAICFLIIVLAFIIYYAKTG